jgi:hypothetical protein
MRLLSAVLVLLAVCLANVAGYTFCFTKDKNNHVVSKFWLTFADVDRRPFAADDALTKRNQLGHGRGAEDDVGNQSQREAEEVAR